LCAAAGLALPKDVAATLAVEQKAPKAEPCEGAGMGDVRTQAPPITPSEEGSTCSVSCFSQECPETMLVFAVIVLIIIIIIIVVVGR
jgi:hypothetical protein